MQKWQDREEILLTESQPVENPNASILVSGTTASELARTEVAIAPQADLKPQGNEKSQPKIGWRKNVMWLVVAACAIAVVWLNMSGRITGDYLLSNNDLPGAIAIYERDLNDPALPLDQKESEFSKLAAIYLSLDRFDDAKRVIDLGFSQPLPRLETERLGRSQGLVLIKQGLYDQAAKELLKHPDFDHSDQLLAIAYCGLRDYTAAEKHIDEKSKNLQYEYLLPLLYMQALLLQGQAEKVAAYAEPLLQEPVLLLPKDQQLPRLMCLACLGDSYLIQKNYLKAVEAYSQVLASYPFPKNGYPCHILERRALAYLALGEKGKANEDLKSVAGLHKMFSSDETQKSLESVSNHFLLYWDTVEGELEKRYPVLRHTPPPMKYPFQRCRM